MDREFQGAVVTKPQVKDKQKATKRLRKLKRSSGVFITPGFLGVLVFFLLPFLVIIYYSLVDNPISGEFVFLDNFVSIVQNNAFKIQR